MSSNIKFLTVKVATRPGSSGWNSGSLVYQLLKTCYSTVFPVKFTVKTGATNAKSEQTQIPLTRALADEGKWELVQRVAASVPFQKTARLRDFLLYVSERMLKHDFDNIRESNIGFAVFGRAPDYNPSEDNIVRVEARHLRKRLADYFANEGKDEPVVIVIPKGSYVPVFASRETLAAELDPATPAEPAASTPEPEAAPPEPLAKPGRWARPLFRYGIAASLVLLAGVSAGLVVQNRQLASQLSGRPRLGAPGFPWTAVFNDRETKIALADSCLVMVEDVLGRRIGLNEYVTRGFMNSIRQSGSSPDLRAMLSLISGRQYTSLADVMFVSKIMQLTGEFKQNVVLTYARNLNIRDFKVSNFVLVGSPRANPWVELFEPKMNFLFDFDTKVGRPLFRNRSPRSGEQAIYMTNGANGNTDDSYAVVALLPNLNRTGNVLIIEGTNMEGTEAGVEYLTGLDLAKEMPPELAARVAKRRPNPPYFEILLKLRTVGGTSESVEPIAYRMLNE
jgi:hypothetical protein